MGRQLEEDAGGFSDALGGYRNGISLKWGGTIAKLAEARMARPERRRKVYTKTKINKSST